MHQPTPEQLARLSHATVREMNAHAVLARATAGHGEALAELHQAATAVLYGDLADGRPKTTPGRVEGSALPGTRADSRAAPPTDTDDSA